MNFHRSVMLAALLTVAPVAAQQPDRNPSSTTDRPPSSAAEPDTQRSGIRGDPIAFDDAERAALRAAAERSAGVAELRAGGEDLVIILLVIVIVLLLI